MRLRHLVLAALCALLITAGYSHHVASGDKARSVRGTITGSVTVDGSTDLSGVVVYLDAAPELGRATRPIKRTISQRDRTFSPGLTVIPQGSTVEFPNDDRVFHNVFSLSRTQRFDLGLYRDGDSRSVTFKRPGVVDIYCNIHPDMAAKIKVVPNRYYAITDRKGTFRIPNVPAGTYSLVAWNGSETRREIKVTAKRKNAATLALAKAPKSKRHTRKDGTPYGRYK